MNLQATVSHQNVIVMTPSKRQIKGFTLIEMLLVMTIISAIIYGSITYVQQRTLQTQIDRTSSQMQQILSAGLSYYVSNGAWPSSIACLQGGQGGTCQLQYLPSTMPNNPWGNAYNIASAVSNPSLNSASFYVYTDVPYSTAQPGYAAATALTIAGSLPLAFTSGDTSDSPPSQGTACPTTGNGGDCMVVSSVNAPVMNLQNTGAVNFAGIYHHGGCIPVPQCPLGPNNKPIATPEVIVVPVSVSGLNNANQGDNSSYPITSFTAYATGGPGYTNPPACNDVGGEVQVSCQDTGSKSYWRACLDVVTELGDVAGTAYSVTPSQYFGQYVTLMAITRCSLNGEDAGSSYTKVYSN